MEKSLREHVEQAMGLKVESFLNLSGGDISMAMKIGLGDETFFCKYQRGKPGYPMLKAEKEGLEAIASTGGIKTPEVLHLGQTDGGGCLILEYVESTSPSRADMMRFGEQLAQLHTATHPNYGWKTDNFIGSLPQTNAMREDWAEFYASQRLIPQFQLAQNKGLLNSTEIPGETSLLARLQNLCSPTRPSLVHGDLWGGNYLISTRGEAYLIDPSVSYAHPGMDLAMSRLFGGFSPAFYSGYGSAASDLMPEQDEIELYQLYYLLVHLNLFGLSYVASVKRILRRFF